MKSKVLFNLICLFCAIMIILSMLFSESSIVLYLLIFSVSLLIIYTFVFIPINSNFKKGKDYKWLALPITYVIFVVLLIVYIFNKSSIVFLLMLMLSIVIIGINIYVSRKVNLTSIVSCVILILFIIQNIINS